MAKVFIGVGHGGKDPGAVGKVREADANLVIALALKTELERHGVVVGISRIKNENDSLDEEIKEANAFRPDLAIDVHNNAGGGDGFEAYIQTNSYRKKSLAIAEAIEKHVTVLGQRSRGMKTKKNSAGTADYYGFLRNVKAPAVILEGFFVDSNDALGFDVRGEQEALGVAYAKGILDYLGIKYTGDGRKEVNATENAASCDKVLSGVYTVTASSLNVRAGAGTDKKILVAIPRAEKVQNYGYFTELDGVKWLYVLVIHKGVTYRGFCSSQYLRK